MFVLVRRSHVLTFAGNRKQEIRQCGSISPDVNMEVGLAPFHVVGVRPFAHVNKLGPCKHGLNVDRFIPRIILFGLFVKIEENTACKCDLCQEWGQPNQTKAASNIVKVVSAGRQAVMM